MLTLGEVKEYLRVDFEDDDALISSLMAVADDYLKASVGTGYDKESERAKILSLILISDLYDNRGLLEPPIGGVKPAVRQTVDNMCLHMRLELRP